MTHNALFCQVYRVVPCSIYLHIRAVKKNLMDAPLMEPWRLYLLEAGVMHIDTDAR